MKRISIIALISLMAIFIYGCMDLNENLVSGITAGEHFTTPDGFEDAVISMYQPLRHFYGSDAGLNLTQFGTDTWKEGQSYQSEFDNYGAALNPTAGNLNTLWNNFYRGINNANTVISRAGQIEGLSEELINSRTAEARFLRAHYYFILVQHFGPLHLTLEETIGVETEARRDPVADVFSAILDDLAFALEYLPETQPDYGRPTKDVVQHQLSKVHLVLENWDKAYEYAYAVISGGNHSLLDNFADVFDPFNQRHSEVIWAVRWNNDSEVNDPRNDLWRSFGPRRRFLDGYNGTQMRPEGNARHRPTAHLITEIFGNDYRQDGLHIRNDSRYSASFIEMWEFNTEAGMPEYAALGDTAGWFTNDPYIQDMSREELEEKPYVVYRVEDFNDIFFASLDKHRFPETAYLGRDFMVMRLAETYLIAAEALYRLGRSSDAVDYFNVVRQRAAFPGIEIPLMTAGELNIDEILDERARELTGEHHRWTDLKRTGKLLERVRNFNPNGGSNIQEHHMLRPIPQAQIDRSSNEYEQNPGY